MEDIIRSAGPWAYVALFALSAGESAAFLGLVVPGESAVLLAGALAGAGGLSIGWVIAVTVVGAVIGDSIGYSLGHHFGGCRDHGLLSRVWSCKRMGRVRGFFNRHGGATVFLARFIGFFRALAPFAAGAVRMPYRPFFAYNVAGAVVWGVGTALAGFFLGVAVERWLGSPWLWLGAGVTAMVVVALYVRLHRSEEPWPLEAASVTGTEEEAAAVEPLA